MYNISRYQIVLLLALFFLGFSDSKLNAQFVAKDNYNYLDFQKKPYYFGMSFSYNKSGYRIDKNRAFSNSQNINVVESESGPGVSLQMIGNLKIGEYFDFRTTPGFTFAERNFIFDTNIDMTPLVEKKVESVFFDMPFQVRFKSAPYKDKRLYVMAGVKYTYDVQSNSRTRENLAEDLILISPHDYHIEYGAGIQIFFPFFIFSPEIRMSQGISNIHIYKDTLEESSVLEAVKSRMFSIAFHFEG